jgi:hypothetical protein
MLHLKAEDISFRIVRRGEKSCGRGKRKGTRRRGKERRGGRNDEESENEGILMLKKLNTALLKAM